MVGKVENKDTRWVEVGRMRGTQNAKGKAPHGHPFLPPIRGFDRPLWVAGMVPKRHLKRHREGAFRVHIPATGEGP